MTRTLAAYRAGFGEGYLVAMENDLKPISDSVVMKMARGWRLSIDELEARLTRAAGHASRRRRTA